MGVEVRFSFPYWTFPLTQCPDCHPHGPFCCGGAESGMRATCRSMQPVRCLGGTCEHTEEELKLPTICIWKEFTQYLNVGNYWLMFFIQCEIFLALDMSGDFFLKTKKQKLELFMYYVMRLHVLFKPSASTDFI